MTNRMKDAPDAAAISGTVSDPVELPVIYATVNIKLPADEMNKLIDTGTEQGEADDRKL